MLNLPSEIIVMLIGMTPIGELRAAIPLALTVYKMSVIKAFFWSVLGNIIPVFFLVFFLEKIANFAYYHSRLAHKFLSWLFKRTRKKHSYKFEVFEEVALILFVAIPLPMTGAWSGALAAFVFGIPPKKSIPLIFLGIIIAGIIVTILTKGTIIFNNSFF